MEKAKPFDIPKSMVWDAYLRVRSRKGAPGVDGESIEKFGENLKDNLYKLWNRQIGLLVRPGSAGRLGLEGLR